MSQKFSLLFTEEFKNKELFASGLVSIFSIFVSAFLARNDKEQGLCFIHCYHLPSKYLQKEDIHKLIDDKFKARLSDHFPEKSILLVNKTNGSRNAIEKFFDSLDSENASINIFPNERGLFEKCKEIAKVKCKGKRIVVSVRSYYDCASFFLDKNGRVNFGHLVVIRHPTSHCYSEIIEEQSFRANLIPSLTILSQEAHLKDSQLTVGENSHYFFEQNCLFIRYSDTESVLQENIESWVAAYFYSPTCYISYGNDDGLQDIMSQLEVAMRRYFNFLDPKIDKLPEHITKKLHDVEYALINAKLLFAIIGVEYLRSKWAMYELLRVLTNKGYIVDGSNEKIDDIKTADVKKSKFFPLENKGFFPLITKEAGDVVYKKSKFPSDDCSLKDYWVREAIENPESKRTNQIADNISKIIDALNEIYDYMRLEAHCEDNFKILAWLTKEAIKERGYLDFYQTIEEAKPEQLPSLQLAIGTSAK